MDTEPAAPAAQAAPADPRTAQEVLLQMEQHLAAIRAIAEKLDSRFGGSGPSLPGISKFLFPARRP